MTEYFNHCLKHKDKLYCKQNKLEQLFIAKTETEWQSFDIARPITKTSPIYKLLDTLLNDILWDSLLTNNVYGVN